MELDISIIIVSYNTQELTTACIRSIFKTVKKSAYEIIVVDNASKDGSVEEIEKLKNKYVHLIKNENNEGFSKANNIGVRQAHGKYVLFLNSDTLVRERTIDGMVDFMNEQKEAGAATCFVELPNGKIDDAAHRGFPTPWRAYTYFSGLSRQFPNSKLFAGYNLTYLDFSKTHEIDACAGAFMIVRRSAGDEVNWWDEDYFWYGEDLDFCYRLKQKDWKIFFVPKYKILHYKGASGGIKKSSAHITKASKETRMRAIDARFDAMRIFYRKHYQKKYPRFLTMMVGLGINLKWKSTKLLYKL